MKSIIIALCMLPLISLAQMKNCEINTDSLYYYECDYKENKINIWNPIHKESRSFLIFEDFCIITHPDGQRLKYNWIYSKTSTENIHIYYINGIVNTKIIFNEELKTVKYFYRYKKEIKNYLEVICYTY
tara:strand:- start:537 stop:923 length:387 start_codon:yes stop_codon:yes gene_type:complete